MLWDVLGMGREATLIMVTFPEKGGGLRKWCFAGKPALQGAGLGKSRFVAFAHFCGVNTLSV